MCFPASMSHKSSARQDAATISRSQTWHIIIKEYADILSSLGYACKPLVVSRTEGEQLPSSDRLVLTRMIIVAVPGHRGGMWPKVISRHAAAKSRFVSTEFVDTEDDQGSRARPPSAGPTSNMPMHGWGCRHFWQTANVDTVPQSTSGVIYAPHPHIRTLEGLHQR